MNPTVSVIVCTRDRPFELERCLTAMRELDPPADEILVVDNSPRASARLIARVHGAAYVFEGRRGLSRARNAGAAAASHEVVAFTDDDAVVQPDWISALLSTVADRSVSAAAGRVIGLTRPSMADLGVVPRRFDRRTPDWFGRANFGGIGIGCNMAFRRSVFEDGYRFCEWLGVGTAIPGNEEHYLFFELLRDGRTVVYEPSVLVHHDDADDPSSLRQRQRRMAEATLPYVIALLVQEPGFRVTTARYLAGGLRGRPRPWRSEAELSGWHPSRSKLVGAAARAPLRYAWSRFVALRSRDSSLTWR